MAQFNPDAPAPLRTLDFTPFESVLSADFTARVPDLDSIIFEASVQDLQRTMAAGDLDAVTLVTYYLYRIRAYDVAGLQSVIELNPDVLTIAAERDTERAAGNVRGPLHGIPILLKDNITTGDRMHTSAGSAALIDNRGDRDALIVAKLREAGAVILGKANLSEFANYVDPDLPNGFSAVGGQVRQPYDDSLDPLGSSTGSAVAVSANLVTIAIGTETSGSVIAPAAINGVVGIFPSRGLISRDHIVPLAEQQDTAGPIARTVADAATLLTVIAGVDANDPVTQQAADLAGTDFTSFLVPDTLRGKRLGIRAEDAADPQIRVERGYDSIIANLEAAGAEVVLFEAESPDLMATIYDLLNNGLRLGLPDYLQAVNPDGSIKTLADVVAFNANNPAHNVPYGQRHLQSAAESTLTLEQYIVIGAERRALAGTHIRDILREHRLDAIVSQNNHYSLIYATAGFPAVTVPTGLRADGAPYGVTFTGDHLQDGALIGMAYAYEQAVNGRVIPQVGQPGT